MWSKYQQDVFDFVLNGTGNGLVEAMPGSGKTTVIEECVKRVENNKTILLLAFNRHIRDELKRRMDHYPNVTVHTINSFGNSVVRAAWPRTKVKPNKVDNLLKFGYFGMSKYDKKKFAIFARCCGFIKRVISLSKANGVFDLEHFSQTYPTLIEDFGLEIPDLDSTGYDIDAMLLQVFASDAEASNDSAQIDFDDQIYLPVKHDMRMTTFDFVFVDEAQDLSPVQIIFTQRAIGGRGLYVGDRRQAIYQFRGADSHAMSNIQITLDATPLPLSICYRCAKSIVREAAKIVPTIETFEDADNGDVFDIPESDFRMKAGDGDVVLCRTTAPLVKECFYFIRQGRKATVKGRDIGKDLKDLIKKLSDNTDMMGLVEFEIKLEAYYTKLSEKYRKLQRDISLMILQDKVETIKALLDHGKHVCDLYNAIDAIFENGDDDGILMMTIHKAKGLEAERVFILRPDQLPHKLATTDEAKHAEENLKFVAITRAQKALFWVHHPNDE